MRDVVADLRRLGDVESSQLYSQRVILNEGADEIERLRAALQRLTDYCEEGPGEYDDVIAQAKAALKE